MELIIALLAGLVMLLWIWSIGGVLAVFTVCAAGIVVLGIMVVRASPYPWSDHDH